MAVAITFNDLFKKYTLRNLALQGVAGRAYEFGKNLSQSTAAALTNGLDIHTLKRQNGYVDWMEEQVKILASDPTMDMPQTHPVNLDVDLSVPYESFVIDVNGAPKPINEDVQNLARQWLLFAVEALKSNSAGLPSALLAPDAERMLANINGIRKFLSTTSGAGMLDLPESTAPDAALSSYDNVK